jgi:hypothetical protein
MSDAGRIKHVRIAQINEGETMRLNKSFAIAGALGIIGSAAFGSSAQAAWPNFSDCPTTANRVLCVDIQSRSGSLTIKGFTVPIGESLNIRGAVRDVNGAAEFVAPRGTNGFFARPIQVPGGILGIDFWLPGNAVTATATLVGPASNIRLDTSDFSVAVPVKLKLSNPIIGPGCQIGSDSNPVRLFLTTGTTNPAPPNRPISGRLGEVTATETAILLRGNSNVDNAFSIPGASGCGINLGLINSLINLKLRLPSAGGNNTMIVNNDIGLGSGQ